MRKSFSNLCIWCSGRFSNWDVTISQCTHCRDLKIFFNVQRIYWEFKGVNKIDAHIFLLIALLGCWLKGKSWLGFCLFPPGSGLKRVLREVEGKSTKPENPALIFKWVWQSWGCLWRMLMSALTEVSLVPMGSSVPWVAFFSVCVIPLTILASFFFFSSTFLLSFQTRSRLRHLRGHSQGFRQQRFPGCWWGAWFPCSLEGLMLKLKLQYFGHQMWRTDSLEKTLMLRKTESRRRSKDRGRDGWMANRFSAHEFEVAPGDGEGQGSLACCSPWGREELNATDRLNWNE